MEWLGDYSWEEIRKEVDIAHKEFFEKRGIKPGSWFDNDFIFGKGINADNPESSLSLNDQPIRQSSQEMNQNPF